MVPAARTHLERPLKVASVHQLAALLAAYPQVCRHLAGARIRRAIGLPFPAKQVQQIGHTISRECPLEGRTALSSVSSSGSSTWRAISINASGISTWTGLSDRPRKLATSPGLS